MFRNICFEISGVCNAKCRWCVTGNHSIKAPSQFITPELFERTIDDLLTKKLIDGQTIISLYNWGEPLLNPDFHELLKILYLRKLRYEISTNASIQCAFTQDECRSLFHLKFSMPGFSQSSYNRIHGFSFNKIIKNIENTMLSLQAARENPPVSIAYHIYQFNLDEIKDAIAFCQTNNIRFNPSYAYFNDYNLAKTYLDNTMGIDVLFEASKDLLLGYVDDLIISRPPDYICPQHSMLTIDEYARVLTCCVLPKTNDNYSIGSLFELTAEEIEERKRIQPVCIQCLKSGIAFWAHNPQIPASSTETDTGFKEFQFFLTILTDLLEQNQTLTAYEFYSKYKNRFLQFKELQNVDNLMYQLRVKNMN